VDLILTSDFPSSLSPEVIARLHACGARARVASIAPGASSRLVHLPLARRRFRSCGVIHLEFVDAGAPRPELHDLAERFDAIYLSGGNPLLFRQRLEDSGLGEQVRAFAATDRPVIAASGGAMQLTPNVSLYRLLSASPERVLSERASFDALGLTSFEILPHLNRHDSSFLDLVARYSERLDRDVIALADGAAVVCRDGRVSQCIGRVVRYSNGKADG
jgi:peptidase E